MGWVEEVKSSFKVSAVQRRKLQDGEYSPLIFDVKPHGCEPGSCYVLSWTKPSAASDGLGNVTRLPRAPAHYITIRTVRHRPDGKWLAMFDVVDKRDGDRYLRRNPPVMDPSKKPSRGDGSEESHYQTTRWSASDPLPSVRKHEQDAITAKAWETWEISRRMRETQRDADIRRRYESSLTEGLDPSDKELVLDLSIALRDAQNVDNSRQVAAIRRRIKAMQNKTR